MRYRRNPQLLASDAADLLREQGIPVIPQAIDVGDVDAEAIRLGDQVEIAELQDGTFMVSVRHDHDWKLEGVEYSLGDAVALASSCHEMAANRHQRRNPSAAIKRCWGELTPWVYFTPRGKRIVVAGKANKFRFFYADTEQQVGPEVSYLRGVLEHAGKMKWIDKEDWYRRQNRDQGVTVLSDFRRTRERGE